jgi:hypothetical protein
MDSFDEGPSRLKSLNPLRLSYEEKVGYLKSLEKAL